ncbi:hypothetical protein BB560_007221, partial [Smittium megazygosporum]
MFFGQKQINSSAFNYMKSMPSVLIKRNETTGPNLLEKKSSIGVDFKSFKFLDSRLASAITSVLGNQPVTKIQEKALSTIPTNENMVIRAPTGTGKTIAFLSVALDALIKQRDLKESEASDDSMGVLSLIGGQGSGSIVQSILKSRHDIVIGTPGTIEELAPSHLIFGLSLKHTKTIILDEADKLIQLENPYNMKKLFSLCPPEAQVILTSATINSETLALFKDYFGGKSYKNIYVQDEDTKILANSIKQSFVPTSWDTHFSMLYYIFKTRLCFPQSPRTVGEKIIVFLPTIESTEVYSYIFSFLMGSNYLEFLDTKKPARPNSVNVLCLHGRMDQRDRNLISNGFRNFDCSENKSIILFSTDISARGMDYPNVSLVIQIGLPSSFEQYAHRIGRTGRASNTGESLIFLSHLEKDIVNVIAEKYKTKLTPNAEYSSSVVIDFKKAISELKPKNNVDQFHRLCSYIERKGGIEFIETIDPRVDIKAFIADFLFKIHHFKSEIKSHELVSCVSSLNRYNDLISKQYNFEKSLLRKEIAGLIRIFGPEAYNVVLAKEQEISHDKKSVIKKGKKKAERKPQERKKFLKKTEHKNDKET